MTRWISVVQQKRRFQIHTHLIKSDENPRADALSRLNLHRFFELSHTHGQLFDDSARLDLRLPLSEAHFL